MEHEYQDWYNTMGNTKELSRNGKVEPTRLLNGIVMTAVLGITLMQSLIFCGAMYRLLPQLSLLDCLDLM